MESSVVISRAALSDSRRYGHMWPAPNSVSVLDFCGVRLANRRQKFVLELSDVGLIRCEGRDREKGREREKMRGRQVLKNMFTSGESGVDVVG